MMVTPTDRLFRLTFCTDAVTGWEPIDVLAEAVRGVDEHTEVRSSSATRATAYVWAHRLTFAAGSDDHARAITAAALADLTPAHDSVRLTCGRRVVPTRESIES